jgi:isopentenyl phosphate kinase
MEADPDFFVIKIGGAAITDKKNFETLHQQNFDFAIQTLSTAFHRGEKFIIVHGNFRIELK